MRRYTGLFAMAALLGTTVLASFDCVAQTPEQQQMWDAQRAQTLAEEKAKADQLAREREARRADPMAWVRTLNPMSAGGWEFRAVSNDGAWATYSTNHQMKRSGKTVTAWLRQEYAESQTGDDGPYLSVVEKVQYNCVKEQERPLLMIYYTNNNIQGAGQTEEADAKTATWEAIVPGSREESNFLWACNTGKSAPSH
jgi:hypothetical protein